MRFCLQAIEESKKHHENERPDESASRRFDHHLTGGFGGNFDISGEDGIGFEV